MMLMPSGPADAATTTKPVYHPISGYSDYAIVQALSDNGEWAVLMAPTSEYQANGRAKLIKVSEYNTPIYLQTTADETKNGKCSAADVSDDGNIVVGTYQNQPAYLNRETGTWTKLPVPSGYGSGDCARVTPDGHYAVGTVYGSTDIYTYDGCVWDLTTGQVVGLPNAPQGDTSDKLNVQYVDISADGRYVIIETNFSYPPAQTYIYDRTTSTYVRPGYEKTVSGIYKPLDSNLNELTDGTISPNGKYFTAKARVLDGDYDEYVTTIFYDLEAAEAKIFTESSDRDIIPALVDNNGYIYGCSPAENPVREWSIRVGNFWYAYSDITSQIYSQNFYTVTNYENTGTPYGLSTDGKVFAAMIDAQGGGSYIAEFPENLADVCKRIDLLDNYTVTPASGTTLTTVSNIEVLFDRDIKALGANNCASLKDANGNVVRNSLSGNGFVVDPQNSKQLLVAFRPTTLDKDKQYTVEIPAGTIALSADETKTNSAITIVYNGRGTQAVAVKSAYPADGSELARIDNTNNAVFLTFDAPVETTDSASAQLIRTSDNTKITDLTVVAQDTMVALYPSATQYLYDGQKYQIVLAKGSVTDLSGKGANEAFELNYLGTYVREITAVSDSVFYDGFQNTSNSWATWMRYEGDHNTPTTEMQGWTFDTDNQPWNFTIRESTSSTDNCAASHSMYSPAGTSDDWMVIPQLHIADANYMLYFDAQSYLESKYDTLQVVVWATDENVTDLTASVIERIKNEGTVVFKERLLPGSSEERLSGDWTRYTVSLAQFAGKNVYIGFWNNNTDQSAIFVDNVLVQNKVKYSLALTNAESVVAQDDITVKGRLTIKDEDNTYSAVTLTLKDDEGNSIATFAKDGLAMKNGDALNFSFDKPLPLTIGESNSFSVSIQLDNYTSTVTSTVKDLAFWPERYVVLEEQTGIGCVYCPLGIVAIEHLKEIYGYHFLPVSLHTYSGDPYASGQSSYASFLFGGNGSAPIGRIDRQETIASPMGQNENTGEYVYSDGSGTWTERVSAEFNTPADMELTLGDLSIDEDNQKFTIPLNLRAAINLRNQDLNIFVAVLEDSIMASQSNAVYVYSDAALGEWGKGGKYGSAQVTSFAHTEVCRAAYGTSYSGTSGFFPQALTAGETYTNSVELSLPQNVFEQKNCKAVVMLIDGTTGLVLNANQVYFDAERQANGIQGVAEASKADDVVVARYTLDGRMISAPQKGINILRYASGRTVKVVVR